jgi:hypothetical protein
MTETSPISVSASKPLPGSAIDAKPSESPSMTAPDDRAQSLQEEKLKLEIADLKRSPWSKPSVVVPILVTLITLGLSQYLGVFDVERKRVENSIRDSEWQKQKIEEQLTELRNERKALTDKRSSLIQEVERLKQTVQVLKQTVQAEREKSERARNEATKASEQLRHTRKVLAMPDIGITQEINRQEDKASIYMINRGQGSAKIVSIQPYVDGRPMPEGPPTASFAHTLDALDMNFPWIRWQWTRDTIEPGKESFILQISPALFSADKVSVFERAVNRLSLEVCYCSLLGDCRWAVWNRSIPAIKCKKN